MQQTHAQWVANARTQAIGECKKKLQIMVQK
jgi:hypothetical protein